MAKELVFGHQNPDTDAIGAAIAFSYLVNQLGYDTEAVALGEPNEETKFALDKFGFNAPRVVQTVSNEVDAVMLVDHNEFQQSVSDIADVQVSHVVDHHRIANFNTANPLFYRAEPLGCTSTVIWKLYHEYKMAIPKEIAGIMMSSIISDTLLFKSPTTTPTDEIAVKDLASLAGVDYEAYGLEMLKAGTDLSAKSEQELVDMDAKSFEMNGKNVRIAQVNTVDVADVLKRQAQFTTVINAEIAQDRYDLFVFVITDILNSNSKAIVLGSDEAKAAFEHTFNQTITDDVAAMPGVVSRKKQIVPQLTAAF